MRKSYCLILMILATQIASGWSVPSVQQDCRKSYRIQGTGIDGLPRDITIQVRRPKVELKGFDAVLEQDADEKRYSGYYRVIGPPTAKQNCAGLVMERLFGITNTFFDADQFVNAFIQNFARPVSGTYQAGDVVVFGANKHVAYVTGPGTSSSRAMIVSKDNRESIVEGELATGFGSGTTRNDPIKQNNGAPNVYRFAHRPSVTEVSPGDCDPAVFPDLHVTIDVNELLRGDLRPLDGASVTLTLSNGEKIPGTAVAGKASFTIPDNSPGRGAAARAGITVKVTLKGFYDKTDSFTSAGQDDRYFNMTLTRTPDNPADADPNVPPDTTKVQLADWEKRFKALEARVAAAEAKKKEFETKAKTAADNVGKVTKAEAKARDLLAELKKLKAAVDRVAQLCKDASKANADLESVVKTIEQKEKEASKLTDDLLKQLDSCSTADDLKRIRDGKTQLKKMVDDMGVTAKQVIKLNVELKRLETESMKDAPEILLGVDYRKGISEQEKIANDAFNAAMDDNNALTPLETQISTQRFSLGGEHSKLRLDYPGAIPPDVDKRLNDLLDRINNLKVSTSNDVVTIAGKLGNFAAITGEADQLISQYRSSICVIKPRQDLIERITDSLTIAGLGLQSIERSDDKIKQCEDRLDCQSQIKKINELLDNGDLEGATVIIAKIKGGGCDTSAVEARWQKISDRISFDLATARNRWRDIASTCDYRAAYEAALVIQKQYPKHPWILQNFDAIQRGYQAETQIRSLVTDRLVPADRDRNYDEAEKILAQIDQIAAAYPCMVAEAKKLRTEYGRGKPADKETERACQELLTQIQAAIAGKRLVEAAKKLAEAKQKCSNVSPGLFTALGDAQKQLDQAIQQAINDIQTSTGKCEYEGALELAEQVQQLRPGALAAADVAKLRQQAEAQNAARRYLEPGLEAIKQKDIKGATSSLRQALGVPNIPLCLRDQITSLLKELEKRQSFIDMTDQVQQATINCNYKEAARLIAQIKLINPREQYITDWLTTNEKILTDLQERERRALELVRQADAIAAKAESASTAEPVDFNNVSALGQQAMNLLTQADKEAPKCMQRQQMEQIRQRMLALSQRKKPEIAASIVLLIDTSGSMSENNKINQAKDAAKRAARQVSKTTEIAILNFDGDCGGGAMHVAAPFTTDVNTLLAAIGGLQPGGGTPMYISTAEAIEYAQKNGRGKSRNLILMSDGGDSCRDKQPQAAAAIRSSNIPVSTIGFDVGNNQQAQGDLSNLATMTGGRTFSASAADPREIIRAFNLAMLPSLLKDFDFGGAGNAVSGYFSQAKTMVQQQNISGALMMLQQANQLAPSSPNLNYNLSLLYEADDQLIPAVSHANNYLKLAPNAVDSADVQNRINEIQQELQKNPRVVMDSSGCRDILTWATTEREIAKRSGNASRIQAILEISISSQRGECDKARSQSADYKSRYR